VEGDEDRTEVREPRRCLLLSLRHGLEQPVDEVERIASRRLDQVGRGQGSEGVQYILHSVLYSLDRA
jgi:hypothetical protein